VRGCEGEGVQRIRGKSERDPKVAAEIGKKAGKETAGREVKAVTMSVN
jgi:hypothetical protein